MKTNANPIPQHEWREVPAMSNDRLEHIADQAGRLANVGSGRIAGVRLDAFAEDVLDLLAYVARLELALTHLEQQRPD